MYSWEAVDPEAVAPSPKFQLYEVIALLPAVEPDPLKVMLTGAVPLFAEAVIAAVGGCLLFGFVYVNGSEWALSAPFVKAAVSVKLVLSAGSDTVQSSEVARVLCV